MNPYTNAKCFLIFGFEFAEIFIIRNRQYCSQYFSTTMKKYHSIIFNKIKKCHEHLLKLVE
jgi:hypothetical protein